MEQTSKHSLSQNNVAMQYFLAFTFIVVPTSPVLFYSSKSFLFIILKSSGKCFCKFKGLNSQFVHT